MMFTPTKWTHHFGVFAGLAGSLGALAAVAVTAVAMRSRRNRTVFAAVVLFVMALSFATRQRLVVRLQLRGAVVERVPGVAVRLHHDAARPVGRGPAGWRRGSTSPAATVRRPTAARRRWRPIAQSPLAIATWLLVVFEVVSLTLAMIDQYPAWSVGRSNLEALTGKTCGLADDVLVEQDPNAGLLTPVDVPVGDALGAATAEGFGPNGIPSDVSADPVMEQPGARQLRRHRQRRGHRAARRAPRAAPPPPPGVNGSRARLPYGLDPARTPVMGSWRGGTQQPAVLRSAWYRLPAGWSETTGRIRCWWSSAAGRFDPGEVVVQWAGDERRAGRRRSAFADVGAAPAWRNLRAPLAAIPADATQIRLVATDDDLSPEHWIALTPPRIPELRTLQDVVGSTRPGAAGLAGGTGFPVPAAVRATRTASSRCRSGASCPTGSAPRPTRR